MRILWTRFPFRGTRYTRLLVGMAFLSVLVAGLVVPRSQAIVNGGTSDAAPSWAAAFLTPNGDIYCAGALIAPNLVLTAKHCDPGSNDHVAIGRSTAQYSGDGTAGIRIRDTIRHPQQDLAIHVLDRSMSLTPISIGSGDPSSDQMSFLPFTLYGYGRTNDVTESPPVYDGRLRTAVGLVSTCDNRFGIAAPQFCLKPQGIQAPCRADSGAPLVVSNHLMAVFFSYAWVGENRCVGSDWTATSVTNRDIKQWVNDAIAANPPSGQQAR